MRILSLAVVAGAIAAATPALAQENEAAVANATEVNVAAPENAVAPPPVDTANMTVPPAAATTNEPTTVPVPAERNGGFPWGVLGLLGLVGLLGRKRSSS